MAIDRRLLRAAFSPGLLAASGLRTVVWPFSALRKGFRRLKRRDNRIAPYKGAAMPFDRQKTAALLACPGSHVVLCGIGLGEFAMMRRVGEALCAARSDAKVSYALRDLAALDLARERLPEANVCWYPTDGLMESLRWLGRQRPDLLVLTERCRYPLLVGAAARFGAQVGLMNGRLPMRDGRRHRLLAPIYRWTIGGYGAMAMQAEAAATITRRYAPRTCVVCATGDLKTDVRLPDLPESQRASLEDWLVGDTPLLAAGSTDNLAEERMVIKAFLLVRRSVACRLLLAPRHPSAIGAVEAAVREAGLSPARRSEGGTGDVLLLDTQGELAHAYAPCVAAYVGGSYGARAGGHNVMEPLQWGVPVAYGMSRGHFESLQALCEEKGVGTRIEGANDLAEFWRGLLTDPDERAARSARAQKVAQAGCGAVARTVEAMLTLLPTPV